eukprot:GHVT01087299.1.p1 GENE.GHVT01087299.1~~GHVT01087299.1.p1  ORF type:complete len:205 (-),score=40.89 GHVT01087299.1:770-1384(-)
MSFKAGFKACSMMAPVTSASPSTSRISAACSWSSGCSSCCCCSSPAPGCRASSSGSHSVTAASPCGLVVAVLPQVQTYAWGVLGGASVVRQLRRACEDSLLRLARDWSAAVQEGGGGGDGGPGPREAAEEGARALASEEEEGRTARSQPAAELWLGLHPNGLNLVSRGTRAQPSPFDHYHCGVAPTKCTATLMFEISTKKHKGY